MNNETWFAGPCMFFSLIPSRDSFSEKRLGNTDVPGFCTQDFNSFISHAYSEVYMIVNWAKVIPGGWVPGGWKLVIRVRLAK